MIWQNWNEAADALSDVLTREGECLAVVDYAGAAALLAEKQGALDAFLRAQASLDQPPAVGTPSYATAERLARLAQENRQLLTRALVVQARVIDCFARAMPAAANAPRYGATGGLAKGRGVSPVALLARA